MHIDIRKTSLSLTLYATILAILVILLITCIDFLCFNKTFYHRQYKSLHTAQEVSMTQKDLYKTTDALLDYLKGERDNLNVSITMKGYEQEAFNSKEISHMSDVKKLYQFTLRLRAFCLGFALAILIVLGYFKKLVLSDFCTRLMKSIVILIFSVAALSLWAFTSFDSFWTVFHQIAFRNDLWLLNPNTDLLINLFPAPFFSALVMRIGIAFVSSCIIMFSISYFYLKKKLISMNKQEAPNA